MFRIKKYIENEVLVITDGENTISFYGLGFKMNNFRKRLYSEAKLTLFDERGRYSIYTEKGMFVQGSFESVMNFILTHKVTECKLEKWCAK